MEEVVEQKTLDVDSLTEAQKEYMRRQFILMAEEKLKESPDALYGDNQMCPLKHTFTDGMYIREIFMPKGAILTSKIHKREHPYFVLTGSLSVVTDKGLFNIQAPFWGVTKPGTKRLLVIHEDTVWITVHETKQTTPEKAEEEIIAKSFDEFPEFNKVGEIPCHT